MQRVTAAAIAACGLCVGTASAVIAFQDDFEDNPVGTVLNAPNVGASWVDKSTGTTGLPDGVRIADSPAIGTRSMYLDRPGATPSNPNGQVAGLSLPGVLVAGNTVEVSFKSNIEYRFNGPMQLSMGFEGAPFGSKQLAFVQVSDSNAGTLGGGGAYAYYEGPGHFVGPNFRKSIGGVNPQDEQRASLNTHGANEGHWDTIRAVLKLESRPGGLGGFMDLFIDTYDNPAGEVQIASNSVLEEALSAGVTDPTQLQLYFARGQGPVDQFGDTIPAYSFLDDISVTVVPVPEPASMGLAAAAFGLLIRRNRK